MKSYPDPFALAPTPYPQNTPEICASALFIIVDKHAIKTNAYGCILSWAWCEESTLGMAGAQLGCSHKSLRKRNLFIELLYVTFHGESNIYRGLLSFSIPFWCILKLLKLMEA